MKKVIVLLCIICISVSCVIGCGNNISKTIIKPSVVITYGVVGKCTNSNYEDVILKLEKRVQEFSAYAWAEGIGNRKIRVCIPGQYDEEKIVRELGKPGALYFCTKAESTPSKKDIKDTKYIEVKNNPKQDGYAGFYKVWLTGMEVKSAEGNAIRGDNGQTQYVVSLKFDDKGAKNFGEMTSQNVGQQTFIIYDNKVLSAPRVNEAILGGEAQIDGQKKLEEAERLASNIRIGALPAELKEISYKVYK